MINISRRKEKEERELEKLRNELGKCSDGSWINVGYYKTLLNMGFTDKVQIKHFFLELIVLFKKYSIN